MSHPAAERTFERHCDVCVVGGSAAGLAAALQLGRQRRSVIVVDSGEPRNAPAAHMHGYLGHEGLPPAELTALGREEVRSYGGEILDGLVVEVTRAPDGRFRVVLQGGTTIIARRVLAATGLVDELPGIDGLAGQWGRGVIHCPFCHGFEVRDQRVVQIVTHPMGLHPARLFGHLTDRLTVVVPGSVAVDEAELAALRAGGVTVLRADVLGIRTGPDGDVRAVDLDDHGPLDADAVVVAPRFRARTEPFAALGLRVTAHPSGLGDVLEVDPNGQTAIAGVYAAGNVTDPGLQVLHAAAHGSRVGAMIAFSLADEDLDAAARPAPNQADWDHRYGGEQLWSGNPNRTLVDEAGPLSPGRALDVGAGEGGDALWLAERGWTVTASDVSQRALDRVAGAAEQRGLNVQPLLADANAREVFPAGAFDLVTAHYASIPRTPDHRAVHNLLEAVAPGGTLLVVNHDLEAMREPGEHGRPFDPDAYVSIDEFLDALGGSGSWEVVAHEKRPRPPHAGAAGHHVHDVVLRARRL